MRAVVALGGKALRLRGQPLTAENQRANAQTACRALAPVALERELVISHGNGPGPKVRAGTIVAHDATGIELVAA